MTSSTMLAVALVSTSVLLQACAKDADRSVFQAGAIQVTSPAFAPGGKIPKKHALEPEGQNVSPALEWSGAPSGTQRFAVIVDDPDAPGQATFVHWVAWNIEGTAKGVPEGVPPAAPGMSQGANDFSKTGWSGPQPPPGEKHMYVFNVYALDAEIKLAPGATAAQLVEAMKGHVLATGKLIGTYP